MIFYFKFFSKGVVVVVEFIDDDGGGILTLYKFFGG